MRILAIIIVFVVAILLVPGYAPCEEDSDPKIVSGKVSVAGKYDSNVDLISEEVHNDPNIDDKIEEAWITEVAALISFTSPWTSPWHLGFELYGLADMYVQTFDDSWGIGRANAYLGYRFGANSISLTNEAKYFTEPDDTDFDNLRNSASLVYTRIFSSLWQARTGYENIANYYPESQFFNYYVNGGFVEIRNSWLPALATYYSYGFQYYQGSYNSSTQDPLSSPEAGYRHTGEIGFESFFAEKNSLIGSYTYQLDDSSGQSVEQIGDFRDDNENLEVDAEFNFAKHKGTLLYSHRFNDRFTLSLYEEVIHKTFFERNKAQLFMGKERTDQLFLSSVWFKARMFSELYAKTRYLYRMNQSSSDYDDFQDHVFLLGFEYRY